MPTTEAGRQPAHKATAQQFVAWCASYVGTTEHPPGSNDGVTVRFFQTATGAYHAAWCVSFAQKGLQMLGVPTFADRSAGVFYCANWARRHGVARSRPKMGYLGCLMEGQGHMVVVAHVSADGSFDTIEGNHHDSVARDHRTATNFLFVEVPGVDYGQVVPRPVPKPRPKFVPRFEVVSGEHSTQVLIGWHRWGYIAPRLPKLVARGIAFKLRRKLIANPNVS